MTLSQRQAQQADLPAIVSLLLQDALGQTREQSGETLNAAYLKAFDAIDADPNQYLMVVEREKKILASCHLSIIPSLTFIGATRLQIEAVRVDQQHRGRGIGTWMINAAIAYGTSKDARIIQLTMNKKRLKSKYFYEKMGFTSTHEGYKMMI